MIFFETVSFKNVNEIRKNIFCNSFFHKNIVLPSSNRELDANMQHKIFRVRIFQRNSSIILLLSTYLVLSAMNSIDKRFRYWNQNYCEVKCLLLPQTYPR